MNIIGWIILGGIAGWIAKVTTGVGEKQGCIFNVLIGVIGGIVGGMIFSYIGASGITGFNIWSLFVAVVGAVIFLWIARFFGKRMK